MSEDQVVIGSPEREIHVQAIVQLEKIEISKLEEHETEIFKMRAKLYRYIVDEEEGGAWKERGVGDVKILKHKFNNLYRIIMRRDKTYKLCANHYITSDMEIKAHNSSEKALVWSTLADYADGESKPETLCIRFGKPESTCEFKSKFEECVSSIKNSSKNTPESEKLADALSTLKVKEEKDNNNSSGNKGIKENQENTDDTETAGQGTGEQVNKEEKE